MARIEANRYKLFCLACAIAIFALYSLPRPDPAVTPKHITELRLPYNGVTSLAFSKDSKMLAIGLGEKIYVFDVLSRQEVRRFHSGRPARAIVFTPDKKYIFTTSSEESGIIRIWSLAIDQPSGELRGHKSGVTRLAVSSDGNVLASGDYTGLVVLWSIAKRKIIGALDGKKQQFSVGAIAFSPDKNTLAVAGGTNFSPSWGEVQMWDIDRLSLRNTIGGFGGEVTYISFTPNGAILAAGGIRNPITFWDLDVNKLQKTIKCGIQSLYSVAFSPDGDLLMAAGAQPDPTNYDDSRGEFRIFDAQTGKALFKGKSKKGLNCAVFSPDGKVLAVAGDGSVVDLWDLLPLRKKGR